MLDFLKDYGVEFGAIGGLAAACALIYQIIGTRRSRQAAQRAAHEKYTADSVKLAERFNKIPDALLVWEGKLNPAACPEAQSLLRQAYGIYHGIYLNHRDGTFPPRMWDTARDEMRDFLTFPYARQNLAYADTIDAEFGRFMRGLTPKKRGV